MVAIPVTHMIIPINFHWLLVYCGNTASIESEKSTTRATLRSVMLGASGRMCSHPSANFKQEDGRNPSLADRPQRIANDVGEVSHPTVLLDDSQQDFQP